MAASAVLAGRAFRHVGRQPGQGATRLPAAAGPLSSRRSGCRSSAPPGVHAAFLTVRSAKYPVARSERGAGRAIDADLGTVQEAFDTNVLGAWRSTLTLLPLLRASSSARVVNVSSEAGSLSGMGGGTPAYRVSKAALNALTRTLATELRPTGILVNAVCPGWVATDMGGPGGRPVAAGATSVLSALDLPHSGPTGGFFRDGRPIPW